MLRLRPAAVLLSLPVLLFACSSSNFEVSETPDALVDDTASGSDTASSEASSDTAVDVVPDKCAPEEGKAKFCIEVKLARPEHPPYNAASGAVGLGLDGKGKVFVALYDKDIAIGPGPALTPKAVITYPPDTDVGGEVDVDKDLPTTIVGSAPAGLYNVISIFEDNLKVDRGSGSKSTLPGDFVLVPEVKDRGLVYPKMKLSVGTTQKVTVELRPWRRLTVSVGIGSELKTVATTNPTIHGDGPMLLGLFDSADPISNTTPFLTLDDAPCVATNIQTIPSLKAVNFGTTIDGGHNMFLALFDYTATPFPGRGTLVSKLSGAYPRIEISKDTWTASATADLVSVAEGAQPTGTPDPLVCP